MSHPNLSRAAVARNANGSRQSEASNPRRTRGLVSLWVAILATVLVTVVVAAPQSAKASDVKIEAEIMTLSDSGAQVHPDSSVSGGQDVAYYTEGSAPLLSRVS